MNPLVNAVGPGFFATLGQRLLAGRDFTRRRMPTGAPQVAIVNETLAKYFFGTDNPIGRHIGWGRGNATDIEIVGVARTRRCRPCARSPSASSTRRTRRSRKSAR